MLLFVGIEVRGGQTATMSRGRLGSSACTVPGLVLVIPIVIVIVGVGLVHLHRRQQITDTIHLTTETTAETLTGPSFDSVQTLLRTTGFNLAQSASLHESQSWSRQSSRAVLYGVGNTSNTSTPTFEEFSSAGVIQAMENASNIWDDWWLRGFSHVLAQSHLSAFDLTLTYLRPDGLCTGLVRGNVAFRGNCSTCSLAMAVLDNNSRVVRSSREPFSPFKGNDLNWTTNFSDVARAFLCSSVVGAQECPSGKYLGQAPITFRRFMSIYLAVSDAFAGSSRSCFGVFTTEYVHPLSTVVNASFNYSSAPTAPSPPINVLSASASQLGVVIVGSHLDDIIRHPDNLRSFPTVLVQSGVRVIPIQLYPAFLRSITSATPGSVCLVDQFDEVCIATTATLEAFWPEMFLAANAAVELFAAAGTMQSGGNAVTRTRWIDGPNGDQLLVLATHSGVSRSIFVEFETRKSMDVAIEDAIDSWNVAYAVAYGCMIFVLIAALTVVGMIMRAGTTYFEVSLECALGIVLRDRLHHSDEGEGRFEPKHLAHAEGVGTGRAPRQPSPSKLPSSHDPTGNRSLQSMPVLDDASCNVPAGSASQRVSLPMHTSPSFGRSSRSKRHVRSSMGNVVGVPAVAHPRLTTAAPELPPRDGAAIAPARHHAPSQHSSFVRGSRSSTQLRSRGNSRATALAAHSRFTHTLISRAPNQSDSLMLSWAMMFKEPRMLMDATMYGFEALRSRIAFIPLGGVVALLEEEQKKIELRERHQKESSLWYRVGRAVEKGLSCCRCLHQCGAENEDVSGHARSSTKLHHSSRRADATRSTGAVIHTSRLLAVTGGGHDGEDFFPMGGGGPLPPFAAGVPESFTTNSEQLTEPSISDMGLLPRATAMAPRATADAVPILSGPPAEEAGAPTSPSPSSSTSSRPPGTAAFVLFDVGFCIIDDALIMREYLKMMDMVLSHFGRFEGCVERAEASTVIASFGLHIPCDNPCDNAVRCAASLVRAVEEKLQIWSLDEESIGLRMFATDYVICVDYGEAVAQGFAYQYPSQERLSPSTSLADVMPSAGAPHSASNPPQQGGGGGGKKVIRKVVIQSPPLERLYGLVPLVRQQRFACTVTSNVFNSEAAISLPRVLVDMVSLPQPVTTNERNRHRWRVSEQPHPQRAAELVGLLELEDGDPDATLLALESQAVESVIGHMARCDYDAAASTLRSSEATLGADCATLRRLRNVAEHQCSLLSADRQPYRSSLCWDRSWVLKDFSDSPPQQRQARPRSSSLGSPPSSSLRVRPTRDALPHDAGVF